jgi:hypothetical protein
MILTLPSKICSCEASYTRDGVNHGHMRPYGVAWRRCFRDFLGFGVRMNALALHSLTKLYNRSQSLTIAYNRSQSLTIAHNRLQSRTQPYTASHNLTKPYDLVGLVRLTFCKLVYELFYE